ncbi:hypothetical protein KC640_00205 [Candidatus Dojkabacteria bacterium]|uniref:Prepilin-type N-terminal cleavage/methylation domain-containing protein n=1 Tax=Candidatus Dojkabacteria bacterium TaxID=2099670 RepID=A0A955KYJ8_9BACT|nr:hypothetical protein [Candidatus Dojkabacteria bacterium]
MSRVRTKALKAFTTIELLLVVAIMAILATSAMAFIVTYYTTAVVDSEMNIIRVRLQRARQLAVGNATGEAYSIKFTGSNYIMFPGTTYSVSDPDNTVFTMDTGVFVSTTFSNDLVTFNSYTGRVTSPGSVTIQAGTFTKQIIINALGIVEDII